MSKINLKTKLYSDLEVIYEYSITGIKSINKLIYKEADVMVTLKTFKNQIMIERKNKDYTMLIDFNESLTTSLIYDIKGIGNTNLKVKTKKLKIEDNNIYIKYELIETKEIYYYELSYEVI